MESIHHFPFFVTSPGMKHVSCEEGKWQALQGKNAPNPSGHCNLARPMWLNSCCLKQQFTSRLENGSNKNINGTQPDSWFSVKKKKKRERERETLHMEKWGENIYIHRERDIIFFSNTFLWSYKSMVSIYYHWREKQKPWDLWAVLFIYNPKTLLIPYGWEIYRETKWEEIACLIQWSWQSFQAERASQTLPPTHV